MSSDVPPSDEQGVSYGNSESGSAPQAEGDQQRKMTVNLNDPDLHSAYANYFLVTSSPEEVALNFAFTPAATDQIRISDRVVISYYTAKRLAQTLVNSVRQYEQAFGEIELDLNKRRKS